jgi:hypothetical protein
LELGEFDKDWIRLVFALNWCLKDYDPIAFTVQVKNPLYESGPYVQAQYLDDEIEIEITSNRYLDPPISGFYVQRIILLGWNEPDENDHPDFSPIIDFWAWTFLCAMYLITAIYSRIPAIGHVPTGTTMLSIGKIEGAKRVHCD